DGARAVGRLRAARRDRRCLLVAGDAFDRQCQAEQLSLAEVRARRPDLRQEFARDAEQVEELVVPVERVERAEQRARRVRLVGEVVAALGQLPHEPRVDGAEREAAWTVLPQQPLELRRREVRIRHEAGALAQELGRQLSAALRRAPVLPDDRVRDRAAGRALPENGRLALVRDRYAFRRAARGAERLLGRRKHALPDLLGVVLDPAGAWEVLRQLGVATPTDGELVVDDEARRAGRALVDREGQRHVGTVPWRSPMDRAEALERLSSQRFDLLVIGGGIVGAGIAEAASAHGRTVALVDKRDFGGATSSASTKLIHGGLRYLRLGDVGLVRESHHERRLLIRVVAPHRVHRLPFLLPLYDDGPFRPWLVQSGIVLYSALARAQLHGLVPVERARRLVPELLTEGLRSCALYADAWTNDARLTLANVRAAADRGAVVVNYAEVVALRVGDGAEVVADDRSITVRATAVVNAAGPWVDRIRRLEDPSARASVRLSKGVHVLVDGGADWGTALTVPHDRTRVSFAVPWEGLLLLGTTDAPHEEEPEAAAVTEDDCEQVLCEAGRAVGDLG